MTEKPKDRENLDFPTAEKLKLRSFESYDRASGAEYAWAVRARGRSSTEALVFARGQSFTVGGQASFRASDPHPSAVEYLLGALGADLLSGFAASASRRGLQIYETEVSISGCLNNPLVFLGVIGEKGHPGLEAITGTFYVSAEAEASCLREVWEEVLSRSPIVNTLQRAMKLELELQIVV
ncbi:MAG: OsmC family protein [Terriglobia bacterium]